MFTIAPHTITRKYVARLLETLNGAAEDLFSDESSEDKALDEHTMQRMLMKFALMNIQLIRTGDHFEADTLNARTGPDSIFIHHDIEAKIDHLNELRESIIGKRMSKGRTAIQVQCAQLVDELAAAGFPVKQDASYANSPYCLVNAWNGRIQY